MLTDDEFDPLPPPPKRTGPGWIEGRCVACGLTPTSAGHDPCIESLPGVRFACCGHGHDNGYIATADGRVFRNLEEGQWKETWTKYLGWLATPQGRMIAEMGPVLWREFGWYRMHWGRSRHVRCLQVGPECRCRWSRRLDEGEDD